MRVTRQGMKSGETSERERKKDDDGRVRLEVEIRVNI